MEAAAARGQVQTVLGPISAESVGTSLMHEHLFIDFTRFYKQPVGDEAPLGDAKIALSNVHWVQYHGSKKKSDTYTPHRRAQRYAFSYYMLVYTLVRNRHNLTLEDESEAISELALFKKAGGSLVVDATTHGIARDPLRAQNVARATGVHVVAGAGYYVAATHTPEMTNLTAKDFEDIMVKEVEQGIGTTGVRAGIVGEIGTSWPITDSERNVLIGAARAAKRTGTMLNIHPGRAEDAPLACVEIVKQAAGQEQLHRTVMSHVDRTLFATTQQVELAETGVTLEFDLFGMEISNYPLSHHKRDIAMPNDAQRMEWVRALIQKGYGKQILLSHDIYTKHRLHMYGGHGYDHVSRNIIPRLGNYDVTEDQIQQIMVYTPRRLLTKA